MRNHALTLTALVASVHALIGCAAPQIVLPLEHDERGVEASEVPAAARQRLEALAGEHAIIGFEWEDRGALIAYEAEWLVDGVEHEATVLADGTVIETEQERRPEDFGTLPPAIRARIEKLRAEGYDVSVARRQFFIYEVDAWQPRSVPADDDEDVSEEIELLLQPDGRPASRSR